MSKLVVKLHGQEIANLTLESGMEYIAGRAADAHIRLGEERGISRHHLKFVERDGLWICECLSKFLLMQVGTEAVEIIELNSTMVFTLPPYEFYFEPEIQPEAPAPEVETEEPIKNPPAAFVQQPQQRPQPRVDEPVPEDTSPKVNNEATVAGQSMLVPYLRVCYPNTADDEVLKLEGHLWVAGRDQDCEIVVESPHISRKHFELARIKEGFFVTDLGSSNGTKINGQKLTPHEPMELLSGDEIQIMNVRMIFEIRDIHFNQRVESLPVPAFDPMLALPPVQWYPPPDAMVMMPPVYPEPPPPEPTGWEKLKKNKVRLALMALIPVLLIGLLLEPKPQPPERDPATATTSISFDNLKPEQKSVVKDSFVLARNLYVQGKYALCLAELAKVHDLIPQFENSKELQSFCEQGLELVRRQEDLDRKERERAWIEQQISNFVEGCKTKLKGDATVDETRACLAEAIVLSPEHPLVIEMIHTAQMKEEERKFLSKQRQAEEARRQKGLAHYDKALQLYTSGRLAASIAELEKFIRTSYPRLADKKEEAKRKLASIEQELKTKVNFLLEQCRTLGDKNRYKEAYTSCHKAVQEDPKNADAKSLRDKMKNDLKREMKTIYEDSVLEESLGNVDSAKEKWRKIMAEDIKDGEYYNKAKVKLRKYGVGL